MLNNLEIAKFVIIGWVLGYLLFLLYKWIVESIIDWVRRDIRWYLDISNINTRISDNANEISSIKHKHTRLRETVEILRSSSTVTLGSSQLKTLPH